MKTILSTVITTALTFGAASPIAFGQSGSGGHGGHHRPTSTSGHLPSRHPTSPAFERPHTWPTANHPTRPPVPTRPAKLNINKVLTRVGRASPSLRAHLAHFRHDRNFRSKLNKAA